jgi:hypothetical protein
MVILLFPILVPCTVITFPFANHRDAMRIPWILHSVRPNLSEYELSMSDNIEQSQLVSTALLHLKAIQRSV